MLHLPSRPRPAVPAVALGGALALSSCGARADDTEAVAAAADSCVDTSGGSVRIGFVSSLQMAVGEINAEDGAFGPATFAEKAEKLVRQDCVAAVSGGWTSSSRTAMLPVFESDSSLLFHPVQYEGLESSPNVYCTGAGLAEGAGQVDGLPRRVRRRLPPHRRQDRQRPRRGERHDHRQQGRLLRHRHRHRHRRRLLRRPEGIAG